ncbi:MAG: multicopper oxidase domain-containing protein [Candidatus Hydrothermarchaeota archaeon]
MRTKVLYTGIVMLAIVALLLLGTGTSQVTGVAVPTVREYTLVVEETQIEYAPGKFFTAWTYNGNVPGPLIKAYVGDVVKVTLVNKASLAHSIHVHGFEYNVTDDGAQTSPGSIVPPGKNYTYTFRATRAGFYPYHCHSDDKYPVSVHIQQGLQGGILIEDPAKPLPAAKEYMVLLNEVYDKPSQSVGHACSYCAMNSKFFALNHRQWPLPQAYNVQTKTTETPTARTGELVRFYVLNLGNDLHTFHLHGHPLYRRNVAANTTELLDADNKGFFVAEGSVLETVAKSPGDWLYHCHMDVHADLGMIGIFRVTP